MKTIASSTSLCRQLAILLFVSLFYITASAADTRTPPADSGKLEGRWDLTMDMGGKMAPSWLEVELSGIKTLVGRFVGTGGSARPISEVFFDGSKMHFAIPPQWDKGDNDMQFEAMLEGDSLKGTMITVDGKTVNWTGHRAPSLRRSGTVTWGNPIKVFNGKDLSGWHANGTNQWVVENGVLRSPHSGANLVTDQKFTDFKLHIEFRYPKESNSGVYLRGRYEVQVEDDKGLEPTSHHFSGIYGFLPPSEMMAKAAGEWQSFDITLVGRMVTVMANGKMVICNQEIPGITGGALDSKEGEPGPIYIQGDHGPVEYRNIIITPAK
ncbi:MAG TPA: DUF1080 domain-containing protein [Chitinophagaceae bacterium]|nr:DUF1080 domain-containing protein [Chitinophagaceae bacterium]